ncbi:MAG: hypothetical protein GC182_08730 [Rhodopseudomonas sp.]|nr:hypothetical protein [Rhodopseudomonas sp.]
MTDVASFDAAPPSTIPADATAPALRKHSIVLSGRKTSITMTDRDWALLKGLAAARRIGISELMFDIDIARARYPDGTSLSEAARRFVRDELAKGVETAACAPAAPLETVS